MNALFTVSSGFHAIVDAPTWGVLLLKMTAILATAWFGHLALLRTNPRWRVLLWRVTAVGLLALPAIAWLLPAIKIHVAQPPMAITICLIDRYTTLINGSRSNKPSTAAMIRLPNTFAPNSPRLRSG